MEVLGNQEMNSTMMFQTGWEEAAKPGSPAACIIARLAEAADFPVAAFDLFGVFLCWGGFDYYCEWWEIAGSLAFGISSPAVLIKEAARLCAPRPLLATTGDVWDTDARRLIQSHADNGDGFCLGYSTATQVNRVLGSTELTV